MSPETHHEHDLSPVLSDFDWNMLKLVDQIYIGPYSHRSMDHLVWCNVEAGWRYNVVI